MARVGDLGSIFLLSLLAMFTPTLLAAVTVMMLLPNPKRLMLGYLLGAYLTSITARPADRLLPARLGERQHRKHTLGPVEDIVVGLLALLVAFVLGSGRDARLQERRRRRKEAKEADGGEKKESWPDGCSGGARPGSPSSSASLLTFPGVSYLTALDRMAKLDAGVGATGAAGRRLLPDPAAAARGAAAGLRLRAEWTQDAVARFRAWLGRNGRRAAIVVAAAIGALLVLRGVVTLLT